VAPKVEEICRRVGPYAEPLIEGWKSDARAELDTAMKNGVAVVSYDCHALKIVKDCKLPGTYAYAGMYRREDIIQLTTPDELRANAPLSAAGLIADLKEGRSVDLAFVTIGKRTTPREIAVKQDLVGTCEGATHYVRSAWIGGIAGGMGKTGKPHSFDEVFTAATGASSTDEYKDGDFEPCRKATADIGAPPPRCSTAVRLELVAIAPDAADAKPFDETAPRPQPCPEGMVLGAGKCALPEKQKAFVCAPNDAAECAEQCGKGDAESCNRLGLLNKNGTGTPKNLKKARELFEKASAAGGAPRADFELGLLLNKEKDTTAADKLFAKACDVGDALVCTTLGGFFDQGTTGTKSGTRAVDYYRRGCNLGYAPACNELAAIWTDGRGVSSDATGAAEVLTRTCSAGIAKSCGYLGGLYARGAGVDKDPAKAKELLEKGCAAAAPDPEACGTLGALQEADKDVEKASASYDKACKGKDLKACARLGALLEKTDKAKAKEHYADVCARLKDKPSCDRAKKLK
jgi:TPR repeat protein